MRKEFIDQASRKLGAERDLLEKDIVLHQLLLDLSEDGFFTSNFLFKGGTCLIKHYLGYFRFSEDIDFTWRDQKVFEPMSQKQTRRYLSGVIDRLGRTFEKISRSRGMDFTCDKSNRDYVELTGGNKTVTFKIWFDSVARRRSFVKVQVNFVDALYFSPREAKLNSLLGEDEELGALFPEIYSEYTRPVYLPAYDIREILCEKVRSILTRRGIKARDYLDIYMIERELGEKVEDYSGEIRGKLQFALGLYERFRENFRDKMELLERGEFFEWGEEGRLLLTGIDEERFYSFIRRLQGFLLVTGRCLE